ncbi:hypothetical protein ACFQ60_24100 [Streptomyces zhihengii]
MSSDQQYPHHSGGGYEPQEPYGTPDRYGRGAQASPYPQPAPDAGPDGHGQPYPADAHASRPDTWPPTGATPYPAPPADPYAPSAAPYGQQPADPYAQQSVDPYAQHGQQSADPYAQHGQQSADPYAQHGAGAYAPGAPAADPYAQHGPGAHASGAGAPPQAATRARAPRPRTRTRSTAPAPTRPAPGSTPSRARAPTHPAAPRRGLLRARRRVPAALPGRGGPAGAGSADLAGRDLGHAVPAGPHAHRRPHGGPRGPGRGAAAGDRGGGARRSAPADTDGYGTPTTSGNSRITDAQRARAEGRSPIIPPGIQPAGLTAVLGLLLAGGAAVGPYALLVPLVLLQAVTAAGWFRLNGMWPARQGIVLAFAGGLAADAALLAAGEGHGPAAIIGALGVWVLLTLVLQLRSHAGADERLQGLMATVVSAALAILAAGHLAAAPDAVVVGGVAVAAATVARALPLPGAVSVVVALAAGAGAGIAAGGLTDLGAKGALLGLAAAGCALIGLRVASYDYPSRFVHMTAGVALPLTAAVPALYLVGRALV